LRPVQPHHRGCASHPLRSTEGARRQG
jgi:hypothetical protein